MSNVWNVLRGIGAIIAIIGAGFTVLNWYNSMPTQSERAAWNELLESVDCADYAQYVIDNPEGPYTTEATTYRDAPKSVSIERFEDFSREIEANGQSDVRSARTRDEACAEAQVTATEYAEDLCRIDSGPNPRALRNDVEQIECDCEDISASGLGSARSSIWSCEATAVTLCSGQRAYEEKIERCGPNA